MSDRSVAWLSLDPADNDPTRFWRYFIAAAARLQPSVGEATGLLRSYQAPPIETILTTVLNGFNDPATEAILVLDDYHVIEGRSIHEAMAFLLEHLPPRLHLAIATRADPPLPLARSRARGELREVRAADLRLTTQEIDAFFNELMSLNLSASAVATLEERTEGWVAGLQLAALAMRDRSDVGRFITAFSGSNSLRGRLSG